MTRWTTVFCGPVAVLLCLLQQASPLPAQAPASQQGKTQETTKYHITGTVVDAMSGQPLARTQVSITIDRDRDSARVEITNDSGRFAFEDLTPGKYVLTAQKRGYVTQMYQQHESFTTAVVVGPDLESENLRFELRPDASISGDVTDEANDAVRHAEVMLFRQVSFDGRRRRLMVQSENTDDEGRYHFGHLNPGTYFVGVSARPWYAQSNPRFQREAAPEDLSENGGGFRRKGFVPVAQEQNANLDVTYPVTYFPNANDFAGAGAITLHEGEESRADFTLTPVPALHVLLRTGQQDPNQGIGVYVSEPAGENSSIPIQVSSSQIGPGVMEITGVPPGKLNLGLRWSKNNQLSHHSQSLQVSGDMEVSDGDNGGQAVISGVVRVDDGSAVPSGAHVLLRNETTGEHAQAEVSANGEFSFKNNPVGTGGYEMMISNAPGLLVRGLSSPNVKTVGRSFQITTAQDLNITMTISKASGRVTGVALKDGKPVGGVMVVLLPQDLRANPALFRRDQSDSDGTFLLGALIPGKYTAVAIENGWDLEWSDQDVMRKYLAGGEPVEIVPRGKVEVKLKVQ